MYFVSIVMIDINYNACSISCRLDSGKDDADEHKKRTDLVIF